MYKIVHVELILPLIDNFYKSVFSACPLEYEFLFVIIDLHV